MSPSEHYLHEGPPHEHALREAGTLALYLSIVILALLVGMGSEDAEIADEIAAIWGSAIGLGIAHLFAYRMTAIVAAGGRMRNEDWAAIGGMIIAVVGIAALATIPYVITEDPLLASTISSVLLLFVIGGAAWIAASRSDLHGAVKAAYVALTVIGGAIVVIIKYTLTH